MAVKLRLRRMGKKKQPIYKVVAADARAPRDGKFLESIGLYNPLTDPSTIEINEDRATYWLDNGAIPTDTVKNLLSKKGILLKRDLQKKGASEDKIEAEMENWRKLHEAKASSKASKKEEAKASAKPSEEKEEAKSELKEKAKASEPSEAKEEVKAAPESSEVKEDVKAAAPVKTEESKISEDKTNEGTAEATGAVSDENTEKTEE